MALVRTIVIVGGGFCGTVARREPAAPAAARSDATGADRARRRCRPRRRVCRSRLSLSAERSGEPHVGEHCGAERIPGVRAAAHSQRRRRRFHAACAVRRVSPGVPDGRAAVRALERSSRCAARRGYERSATRASSAVASGAARRSQTDCGRCRARARQPEACIARRRRAGRRSSSVRRRPVVDGAAVFPRSENPAHRQRLDCSRRDQRCIERFATHSDVACAVASRARCRRVRQRFARMRSRATATR